ncbi:hypothetical protein JYU34_002959 [Plutella xylostella]|uniref:Uncharacterized protein n=1 Tax=Plutella xylostella TaxID=51655 RepID=A0ABQ7R3K4_PLUXY|nr:hypothetical protein JYU34_002959 [Plutella xylostella]
MAAIHRAARGRNPLISSARAQTQAVRRCQLVMPTSKHLIPADRDPGPGSPLVNSRSLINSTRVRFRPESRVSGYCIPEGHSQMAARPAHTFTALRVIIAAQLATRVTPPRYLVQGALVPRLYCETMGNVRKYSTFLAHAQ